ncbi:uncharacterized protein LOC135831021 isoform X1 [Sycon ciliatum]|uniref:uncharacterized protein LOC135831021 isoform X1 n=2 Tax=Sycon ciliatum TaxID=27933 RepID=UPI0031F6E76A
MAGMSLGVRRPTDQLLAVLVFLLCATSLPVCLSAVNGTDHINIWIVTHTHDDVGWLQTVDQYYISQVQWILDTSLRCIAEDSSRRFTYVEQAYFYRWWNEQSDSTKQRVIQLAKSKQLEFNLGGWCMNDEGTTSYFSVIDQMSEGALFIHDEFGPDIYPKVGWHVDPFGHSSVTPSLWADMGFDAHGIDRIDFRIKDQRKATKELEFVWRGSRSFGPENQMFTHIMDSMYCTPAECQYDRNTRIQTDPLLPTYQLNFIEQGEAFVNMSRQRNQWYRHDHILIPFGCDFEHQNAYKSFMQMDKLIDYVNSNATLNATVRYGTFGTYIEAINALNITWPVYTGDFYPYVPDYGQYFGGYLTSRPHLKGYIRSRAAVLRTTELLAYIAAKSPAAGHVDWKDGLEQIGLLRRAMGASQHHDAISGTEKQAVADDYYLQLFKGTTATQALSGNLLGSLLKGSAGEAPQLYVNSSQVLSNWTADEEIAVVVFNSLAWETSRVITVLTNRTDVRVFDGTGAPLEAQQLMTIPEYDPLVTGNHSSHQLLFIADLPALGFQTYYLRQGQAQNVSQFTPVEGDFEIENGFMKACFSSENRTLDCIAVQPNSDSIVFHSTLAQYMSAAGNNERNSGAYVFRPMQDNYIHVGGSAASQSFHQLTWHFYRSATPFAATGGPVVLATARGDPGHPTLDTFTASVASATVNQTGFQIWKNGNMGWQEDMWLNYATLDTALAPCRELSKCTESMQYGVAEVDKSATRCSDASIVFNKDFKTNPLVYLTVDSEKDTRSAFTSVVISSSPSSVKLNVCRVDTGAGSWTGPVRVNWLAVAEQDGLCEKTCWGQENLSGKANGTKQLNISVSHCQTPMYIPIVLLSVQSSSGQVYGTSVASVASTWFLVNIQPVNGTKEWEDGVKVNWLIFERNTIRDEVAAADSISLSITRGPVVQEVRQVFKNHYAATYRLYQGKSPEFQFLEQKFDIGPLDLGRELVTTIENSKHGEMWYSDDSGLELIPRQFDGTKDEPVAGNFYPMVLGLYLNDTKSNFTLSILSDRSHSSAYLGEDVYEIMLHRRCLADDFFGVGEVLNETDHIQPVFWLVPSYEKAASYDLRHKMSLQLQNPPTVMFGKASASEWAKTFATSFTALKKPFPENVHLLSLKARNTTSGGKLDRFVFRLQHTYERDEPSELSNPVTVDLSEYFADGLVPTISSETTLTGNRERSSVQRLKWRAEGDISSDGSADEVPNIWSPGASPGSVSLVPRQIRTYITQ